jgi:hypothetical protein
MTTKRTKSAASETNAIINFLFIGIASPEMPFRQQ